jgi:peroxiredoxin
MKRKSILFLAVLTLMAIISWSANVGQAGGLEIGTTIEDFTLPDTNGENKSFNDLKGEKGAVVVWLSVQCPMVKAYNDRINEIAAEFQSRGINFIGINSNVSESPEAIKTHAAQHYKFPVLIDKGNVLADKFGATKTPEIYYFDAKNVLLYHGAIDNDKNGTNITANYLRDAASSNLSGKKIETPSTNAFGCTIKRVEKK